MKNARPDVVAAILSLALLCCTSTTGPDVPELESAIEAPVCEEGSTEPGCIVDNPECGGALAYECP